MGTTIIPSIRYTDAVAAMHWLCEAFGFTQHLVVPDSSDGLTHAQLTRGNAMVMIGSARNDDFGKLQAPLVDPEGPVSQSIYLIVSDVEEHHRIAKARGAQIVMEPQDQPQGGKLYTCRDLEGNLWNFGSYNPWRSPIDEPSSAS